MDGGADSHPVDRDRIGYSIDCPGLYLDLAMAHFGEGRFREVMGVDVPYHARSIEI
jgi:hypothetical protein